jgi:hypothetical protein
MKGKYCMDMSEWQIFVLKPMFRAMVKIGGFKNSCMLNLEFRRTCFVGARGSVVIKALCYKLEGHGFDTR